MSRFETLLQTARAAGKTGSWDVAASQTAAALALWRGEPLCDVESDALAQQEVARLAELRLRATETRIEADLRLGRHAEVVAELEHLVSEHPLRENLHAQLMLALYHGGRQAESLAVYRRSRQTLVDMLGIEPGEGLRDLHQRILSGDSRLAPPVPGTVTAVTAGLETPADSGPVVPRQLPRTASRFTGRDRELAELSRLVERTGARPAGSLVISAIGGTAGVGKTTLAVKWAHQVSGQFPDGQLYVNLRGYAPERPVAPGDALAGFLRAFGLPGERIPPSTDERAAVFRSLLAGRQVLVVLDNAREVEQVRPLLPGSSSCLVVVTSRDTLAGLVALDGAVRLELDLLPPPEAARLLRDLIGERAAADPDAVTRLAGSCCRLPLALRVAAELANARPAEDLADLAAELAGRQGRLDLLEAAGDSRTAVREVFSWSYRNLDVATARVFRLLGLHPGPDFDIYATAALAGADLADARASLGRLARAHLIQPVRRGRYGIHDLLRDYARELASRDTALEQRDALTGLFDYYVHTAETAATTLSLVTEASYKPIRPEVTTAVPVLTDTADASAWLRAERASLVAAAVHAADHGWPGHVITLSAVLFIFLDGTFHPADSRTIHASAYRAAQACGDRNGEAHALNNLAGVDWRLGQFRRAAEYLHQSLALFRETGDRGGEARTLNNLGVMSNRLGRFPQAIEYLYQTQALCRETGDRRGEARLSLNLSFACERLGRYHEAMDHARHALSLGRELGNSYSEAYGLIQMAAVDLKTGRYQEAAGHCRRSLELFRQASDHSGEANALVCLADVGSRAGQYEQAVSHAWQGLALCREIGEEWVHEAWALNTSGDVLFVAGHPAEARVRHTAALELSGRTGDPYDQARAHHGLGRAHLESGDPGQARVHWRQALVLYTEMGTPEAEDVRDLLAGLPAPAP